jgi:hypothetical protein
MKSYAPPTPHLFPFVHTNMASSAPFRSADDDGARLPRGVHSTVIDGQTVWFATDSEGRVIGVNLDEAAPTPFVMARLADYLDMREPAPEIEVSRAVSSDRPSRLARLRDAVVLPFGRPPARPPSASPLPILRPSPS